MVIKIKSYEPYHIGIKFKPIIQLDIFVEKLTNVLKKEGYDIKKVDDVSRNSLLTRMEPITIATKDNTKIQLNFLANSLNIVGNDIKKVYLNFENMNKQLSAIDYDVREIILFYEIFSVVIIDVDKIPSEVLNKTLGLKSKTLDEVNYPISISSVRFNGQLDDFNLFDASIEKNPLNPNKTFRLITSFRSTDLNKIKSINDHFENLIKEILNSLKI